MIYKPNLKIPLFINESVQSFRNLSYQRNINECWFYIRVLDFEIVNSQWMWLPLIKYFVLGEWSTVTTVPHARVNIYVITIQISEYHIQFIYNLSIRRKFWCYESFSWVMCWGNLNRDLDWLGKMYLDWCLHWFSGHSYINYGVVNIQH